MDVMGAIYRSYHKRKAAGMTDEWFEKDRLRLLAIHTSPDMQRYINEVYGHEEGQMYMFEVI